MCVIDRKSFCKLYEVSVWNKDTRFLKFRLVATPSAFPNPFLKPRCWQIFEDQLFVHFEHLLSVRSQPEDDRQK